MKRALVVMILLAMILPLGAQSLWRDRNIYSAGETLRAGDAIMIDINDVSQMRFSMELKGKNVASVSSNPDVNITGFLPKVAADRSVDNTDNMTLSGRGNMKLEIAAVVGAPNAQGLFPLQGTREYRFNGASNLFTVTGLVAPAMLRGRRISSNNVLNFRLDVRGTRQGLNLPLQRNQPGEGEEANADLTEAEKQQIIIDYLQRMINEISR